MATMKQFASILCFASLLFVHSATAAPLIACPGSYALCTTATCVPVPGDKDKALCNCIVQEGTSIGESSCDARKTTQKDGKLMIVSTYSFNNAGVNRVMRCEGEFAWTDCLDMPCVVDPENSNLATCTCDIKHSSFITFGGQCDTSTCGTALYSGATLSDYEAGSNTLIMSDDLSKNPMNFCQSK